jgi:hypothetical protein
VCEPASPRCWMPPLNVAQTLSAKGANHPTGSSLGRCTAWIVFDEPLYARPLVDDDKSLVASCHGLDRLLFMPRMEGETVVLRANRLILSNRHLDVRLAADAADVTIAALTEKLEKRLFVIELGLFGGLVDLLDPLVHRTYERLVSSCSVETSVHGLLRFLVRGHFLLPAGLALRWIKSLVRRRVVGLLSWLPRRNLRKRRLAASSLAAGVHT